MKLTKIWFCFSLILMVSPIKGRTLGRKLINHNFEITIITKKITAYHKYMSGGPVRRIESLRRGLTALGIPYNENPQSSSYLAPVVIVTMDEDALNQMIEFKKNKIIKKLIAGPNIMIKATDKNNIARSKEVDLWLHPSQWPKIAWEEDMPSLIGKIALWPGGINPYDWQPESNSTKNNNVLIYGKKVSKDFTLSVKNQLIKHGWNPKCITYGSYHHNDYKNMLKTVRFMVLLSVSESQGNAALEAWAMNVPTIVWNPQPKKLHGRIYSTMSSCPYLSAQTGLEWKTIPELHTILKNINTTLETFSPRAWVWEHMTDVICTKQLLDSINTIA